MLHAEDQPDEDIGGDDGCEGEGDVDLKEILVFHLVALSAKNADTRNVGKGVYKYNTIYRQDLQQFGKIFRFCSKNAKKSAALAKAAPSYSTCNSNKGANLFLWNCSINGHR